MYKNLANPEHPSHDEAAGLFACVAMSSLIRKQVLVRLAAVFARIRSNIWKKNFPVEGLSSLPIRRRPL